MKWYRIIETDNHGGDYPDEKFYCWCRRNREEHLRWEQRRFCSTIGCYKQKGHQDTHGMPNP